MSGPVADVGVARGRVGGLLTLSRRGRPGSDQCSQFHTPLSSRWGLRQPAGIGG